ncbi:MAG: Mrp/NBP35 family ATP-binding protein [Bacteroidales bacterium]|nr:Mrp/NBP35 family ATP-binding protein [Bacteroidales bacterium]
MTIYPKLILDALATVRYPGNGKDLVTAEMVTDNIRIEGNKVSFSLIFDRPNDPFIKSMIRAAETAILTYVGEGVEIKGNITPQFKQQPKAENEPVLPKVKNIIAIASGKGGVGKSTVSSNLAVALARNGFKVGLLDADIFGPSVPTMFNCEEARPVAEEVDGKDFIKPIEQYGIKLLSIGFFVNKGSATVWRGGMASNAIKQLVTETAWGELDYLLIDLPPGTSDIHLTIVQLIPLTGAIIVTTPQEVALADARKGVDMFQNPQINVPIVGIVENMSWFTPAELPENKYYIFGKGGGENLAKSANVPLLAQIPLIQSIREGGDEGKPVVLSSENTIGAIFDDLVRKITTKE